MEMEHTVMAPLIWLPFHHLSPHVFPFKLNLGRTGLTSAFLFDKDFVIQVEAGLSRMEVKISAGSEHTEFSVSLGDSSFATKTPNLFSPMQWMRVCISLEGTKGSLVISGGNGCG